MQTVTAELVPNRGMWARTVPPADLFDTDKAIAAIDWAALDFAREMKSQRRRASARARNAVQRLADIQGRLDQLRSAGVEIVDPAIAVRVRSEIMKNGDALFQEMERRAAVGEAAIVPVHPMGGDDSSLLEAAVVTGGLWLLDRWLGRGRHRY